MRYFKKLVGDRIYLSPRNNGRNRFRNHKYQTIENI